MEGEFDNAKVDDLLPAIRTMLADQKKDIEVKDEYSENGKRIIRRLNKGLFIKGITGAGKTHTLYSINSVLKNWGNSTGVLNWVKLLWEVRDDNYKRANQIIKDVCSNDFILIDDIGTEQPSERNVETLYYIIDEAYIKKRTIFMTTNLTDDQFIQKYGNRFLSRIGQMCMVIQMPDEDKRINK